MTGLSLIVRDPIINTIYDFSNFFFFIEINKLIKKKKKIVTPIS